MSARVRGSVRTAEAHAHLPVLNALHERGMPFAVTRIHFGTGAEEMHDDARVATAAARRASGAGGSRGARPAHGCAHRQQDVPQRGPVDRADLLVILRRKIHGHLLLEQHLHNLPRCSQRQLRLRLAFPPM